MTDSFNIALQEVHQAMEDEFNRVCGVEGWSLRDISWMRKDFWNEFVEIAGVTNIKNVSSSLRNDWEDGIYVRGMVLCNQTGMHNLRKWSKAKRHEV